MKDLRSYILEGFKLGKNKVKKEENDFVYLDLPSKTLWAKYNVGAKPGSTTESWYGDYFMWGDPEPADNKICDWNNYKYTNGSPGHLIKYCTNIAYWDGKGKPDNKLTLDEEDDMANANMGGDWKMPTKEQLQELIDNTTSEWVKNYKGISGLNGILFTSKTNDNTLFIPAAGLRNNSTILRAGQNVKIWSSTLRSSTYASYSDSSAYYLDSSSNDTDFYSNYRCLGFSVRGVMIK